MPMLVCYVRRANKTTKIEHSLEEIQGTSRTTDSCQSTVGFVFEELEAAFIVASLAQSHGK